MTSPITGFVKKFNELHDAGRISTEVFGELMALVPKSNGGKWSHLLLPYAVETLESQGSVSRKQLLEEAQRIKPGLKASTFKSGLSAFLVRLGEEVSFKKSGGQRDKVYVKEDADPFHMIRGVVSFNMGDALKSAKMMDDTIDLAKMKAEAKKEGFRLAPGGKYTKR